MKYIEKKGEGIPSPHKLMAAEIADPELEKIKKKIRWLRWKSDVLLREVRLMEKLRKGAPRREPKLAA